MKPVHGSRRDRARQGARVPGPNTRDTRRVVDGDSSFGGDSGFGAGSGFGILANEEIVSLTLEEIERAVDTLASIDLGSLGAHARLDVSRRMDRVAKRVTGLRYDVVGVIAAQGDWEGKGARTAEIFEQQTTNVSWQKAKETVNRAQALVEDLPLFREALRAGRITDEYVDAVRKAIKSPALKEQLSDERDGERKLLRDAMNMDADRFAKRVKAWAIKHAPSEAEAEARADTQEEKLHLFDKGEYWVINGRLTSVNGILVNNMLDAVMRASKGIGEAEQDPDEGKARPPDMRAAALVELCARSIEDGAYEPSARISPHVSVHCSLETLAVAEARYKADQVTGREPHGPSVHPELGRKIAEIAPGIDATYFEGLEPATFDDGNPLTPAQLQMVMSDAQITRVVFGQRSEVVDVGRRYRTATPAQARAIIARDRHCQYPGCSQTYTSSRLHHSHYWENGGHTDLNNMVMVCWYHHNVIHQKKITAIHYAGGWEFVDSSGKVIAHPFDQRDPAEVAGSRRQTDQNSVKDSVREPVPKGVRDAGRKGVRDAGRNRVGDTGRTGARDAGRKPDRKLIRKIQGRSVPKIGDVTQEPELARVDEQSVEDGLTWANEVAS